MSESSAHELVVNEEKVPDVEQIKRAIKEVGDELDDLVSAASPRVVPLKKWADLGTLKVQLSGADEQKRKKIAEALVAFGAYISKEKKKVKEVSLEKSANQSEIAKKVSRLEKTPDDLLYATDETIRIILSERGSESTKRDVANRSKITFLAGTRRFSGMSDFMNRVVDEYNSRITDRKSRRIENFRGIREKDGSFTVGLGQDAFTVFKAKSGNQYFVERKLTKGKKEFTAENVEDALEYAWSKTDKSPDALIGNPGVDDLRAENAQDEDPRDVRVRELEAKVASLESKLRERELPPPMPLGGKDLGSPEEATPTVIRTAPTAAPAAMLDKEDRELSESGSNLDLKERHVRDVILRSFAHRAGIDANNPKVFNALRSARLASSIDTLRKKPWYKRFAGTVWRAIVPALAAAAAGAIVVAGLSAFAPLAFAALGAQVGLGALAGKVAIGALVGAPTALGVRGAMQYQANKKYGVDINWKNAFVPFYRNKGQLGKTVFTADMVRDMAASGKDVERALQPHFDTLKKLETKRDKLQERYEKLIDQLGSPEAVSPHIVKELADAKRAVLSQENALSDLSILQNLRDAQGRKLDLAAIQAWGEKKAKWKRVIGTGVTGALAGGLGGGFLREGIASALAPSGGGTGLGSAAGGKLGLIDPSGGGTSDVPPPRVEVPPGRGLGSEIDSVRTENVINNAFLHKQIDALQDQVAELKRSGVDMDIAQNEEMKAISKELDAFRSSSGIADTTADARLSFLESRLDDIRNHTHTSSGGEGTPVAAGDVPPPDLIVSDSATVVPYPAQEAVTADLPPAEPAISYDTFDASDSFKTPEEAFRGANNGESGGLFEKVMGRELDFSSRQDIRTRNILDMALQHGIYDKSVDMNAAFDTNIAAKPENGNFEYLTRNLASGDPVRFGTMNQRDIMDMMVYVSQNGPGGGPMSGSNDALTYLQNLHDIAVENGGYLPEGFDTKIK